MRAAPCQEGETSSRPGSAVAATVRLRTVVQAAGGRTQYPMPMDAGMVSAKPNLA